MPTPRQIDDVVDLASLLLTEYRGGTALRESILSSAGSDQSLRNTGFRVEAQGSGSDLRGVLATLDAIQFAFDAAAVAVLYDLQVPDRTSAALNQVFLRDLATRPRVSLQIIELRGGSWKTVVKAVAEPSLPRTVILSIATLGAAAVAVVIPPLGVPLTVMTGVGAAAGISDAIKAHAKANKLEAEVKDLKANQRKLQGEQKELRGEVVEVREQLKNIQAKAPELLARAVDATAIQESRPTIIKVQEGRHAA